MVAADPLDYRVVEANGLRFRVAEAGSGDRLALCLHGFPELAFSWRHQLPLLADLGYRVWAPDQRGYGGTDRPSSVADYRMEHLAADVAGLIDVAAPSEVVLIGHDWGAAVAWYVAMHRVRRLDRLVIMNVPHPACFLRELRTFAQLRRSWYILFFQIPWLPEWILGRKRAALIGRALRDSAVQKHHFSDEVLEVYRHQASQPGALTAMLNWYRAAGRGARAARSQSFPVIETPTLLIWGEQDTALTRATTRGTGDHVTDLTVRYLPDSGHWVQQEQPEVVNAMLAAYLSGNAVPQHDTATSPS
jgi:epoxide hydrolase 4